MVGDTPFLLPHRHQSNPQFIELVPEPAVLPRQSEASMLKESRHGASCRKADRWLEECLFNQALFHPSAGKKTVVAEELCRWSKPDV